MLATQQSSLVCITLERIMLSDLLLQLEQTKETFGNHADAPRHGSDFCEIYIEWKLIQLPAHSGQPLSSPSAEKPMAAIMICDQVYAEWTRTWVGTADCQHPFPQIPTITHL